MAEDILQQTYIAAFESIDDCQFDGPGGYHKWLDAIDFQVLFIVERDLRRQKRDIGREVHDRDFVWSCFSICLAAPRTTGPV